MKDVLALLLEQPDGSTELALSRDEYVALQAEVRRYNARYMRNTGERRGVMMLGHWDHRVDKALLTVRPHERMSRYGVRKGSVRQQLEALEVGQSLELNPAEIDAANVRVSAHNIGPGLFRVNASPGRILVTRMSEKSNGAKHSLRDAIMKHMRNYNGPAEFHGNEKSIRMYVSQWNAENDIKYSASRTKNGCVVSLTGKGSKVDDRAVFLSEMALRASNKGDATDEEIERFKEIARWVVSTLKDPVYVR